MIDRSPVNFSTIGAFFQIPGKTIYTWYRECLSGFPEAVSSGEWGKNNFIGSDNKQKIVPILKPENLGAEMAIDEKMIDDEFYTVFSNRQTGKIALLAETLRVDELNNLVDKMDNKNVVKEITLDLSPTYEAFCTESFSHSTIIADKFHVVKHIVESVQSMRLRLKQEELSTLPVSKKQRHEVEQATKLSNGETRIEMLTRSRYLLFKMESTWTFTQQKRAKLLFETFPTLKITYELTQQLRHWLDRKNIGKKEWELEKELIEWYEVAEQQKLPEIENLIRLIGNNEQKILNYFINGNTNAKAEAINGKIQRFITSNYGVRDTDFFMYRLANYYS
ncbi:MAG: transposase [Candidatus Roizmanbacteria bacterium]